MKSSFNLYVCPCFARRAGSWTVFSVIAPLSPQGCFFESDTNVITEGSLLLVDGTLGFLRCMPLRRVFTVLDLDPFVRIRSVVMKNVVSMGASSINDN